MVLLALPESLRRELKRPLGPLVEGGAREVLAEESPALVAVGDVTARECSLVALERLILAVIDGRVERSAAPPELGSAISKLEVVSEVANPPGHLNVVELEFVLERALGRGARRGALLVVEGEEDLAPLAILCSRSTRLLGGALLMYGQPGEGAVVLPTSATWRAAACDLLSLMEVAAASRSVESA